MNKKNINLTQHNIYIILGTICILTMNIQVKLSLLFRVFPIWRVFHFWFMESTLASILLQKHKNNSDLKFYFEPFWKTTSHTCLNKNLTNSMCSKVSDFQYKYLIFINKLTLKLMDEIMNIIPKIIIWKSHTECNKKKTVRTIRN